MGLNEERCKAKRGPRRYTCPCVMGNGYVDITFLVIMDTCLDKDTHKLLRDLSGRLP